VCIRYSGNVSTEPLPRNDRGNFTEPVPCNDKETFTEPLPSNDGGYTQGQQISLHLFFQNKKSKLKRVTHILKYASCLRTERVIKLNPCR
jgi:hypothetical protein